LNGSKLFDSLDGRMSAAVRIVAFIALGTAMYLAIFALGGFALRALNVDTHIVGVSQTVTPWFVVIALVIAHAVALKWFNGGAPWASIGLGSEHATLALLLSGASLGVLAIGVPSGLLLLTKQLVVVEAPPGSWGAAALRATLFLLPASLIEELFLRGYVFATLRNTVGWKWALIGTSVTFGLLHLQNPGASPESTLLVVIAGFFLGTIVLVTGSVYAAWMAHFLWNWTMAVAMHTAVSGIGMPAPAYRVVDNGPDWLTGGAWGPEGGFAAGVSMIVFTLILMAKQPPWSRPVAVTAPQGR
jgi:membrane protease YdiL (CAAX protease family)